MAASEIEKIRKKLIIVAETCVIPLIWLIWGCRIQLWCLFFEYHTRKVTKNSKWPTRKSSKFGKSPSFYSETHVIALV